MKARFILYEVRKWIRNPMTLFLLTYPIVFSLLARFGLPYIEERFHVALTAYYHVILGGLMVLTAFATGALIGFFNPGRQG